MAKRHLLNRVAKLSFASGAFLGVLGVVLVALGSAGDTEFTFFGQSFRSANVGIASIFIGGVLIVLNIRRTLKSFDSTVESEWRIKSGQKAPGQLTISDIQIIPDPAAKTCLVDVRASNVGGSEVVVNEIAFTVLDVGAIYTRGFMEFSKIYDLDISDLKKVGDTASCKVAHVIKPGESDRIGVKLIATQLGTGVFRGWTLRLTLTTNFGPFSAEPITVWLPHQLGDGSVSQTRYREG